MTALPAAQEMLLTALLDLEPASVLAVTAPGELDAVQQFRTCRPDAYVRVIEDFPDGAVTGDRRFELGVLCGVLEALEDKPARHLISLMRDQYCDGLLLLVRAGHWRLEQYLALGFERRGQCVSGTEARDLYWYHVDRYNPEREWNNPDHWANPDNFRRYRW